MEVAAQCRKMGALLKARWLPRLQDEESDALSDFDFRHFGLARRVAVDLNRLPFLVMPELLAAGDTYEA